MTFSNHPRSVIVTGGAAASIYLAIAAITVINVFGLSLRDDVFARTGQRNDHVVVAAPLKTRRPNLIVAPSTSPGASSALSAASAAGKPNANGSVAGAATKLSDAALLQTIRTIPQGVWAVDGSPAQAEQQARNVAAGSLQTLIVYDIPGRDCGSYSAGGAGGDAGYQAWIDGLARGIGGRAVRVVVEPDALGQCVTEARSNLVKYAATTLQAAGAHVYIDASQWVDAATMADRLKAAGIASVTGFSLNVSGYETTATTTAYGRTLSALVGGKHFVIDTSRNGAGPKGSEWCNPAGRALGVYPTTATANALIDGLLWLKNPGESDGECTEFGHHDPAAGVWWPSYALSLGRMAGW